LDDSDYNLGQTDLLSFNEASRGCNEPFYGNHYRAAIENGIVQGKEIGETS
jgi:hypothetical protein